VRIELALDSQGMELIENLKVLTGIKTHKEFFNNAITLFEWAVLQETQGRIVCSVDEQNKNYRELVMPSLQHARRSDQKAKVLQEQEGKAA
jgi:hypothetical protein